MEVDEDGLDELAAQPDVLRVDLDTVEHMSLAQSTTLIQSSVTAAAGQTGAGWSIAILDTGVERNHPFFGSRVVYEHCFSTTSSQSTTLCPNGAPEQSGPGAGAPCVAISGCDHGTHVAGIAAGSGSSFDGVAPGANILAFQVFSRFDSVDFCGTTVPCVLTWTSDQIRALDRVFALRTAYNIAAVNMSLGGGRYFSQSDCDGANSGRKTAIDNLRSVGIATIAASGNEGFTSSMGAPGCISSAISVGSTTDSGTPTISSFSNGAPFLSLLAPGSNIESSVTNGGFGFKAGTSMATPHVAGAWAVIKGRIPSASVTSVLSALQSTGMAVADTRPGSGNSVKSLIRVNDAMNAITPPACTYSISPTDVTIGSGPASGNIMVSTQAGCAWSAASDVPFITFQNGSGRSGTGSLAFTVAGNPAQAWRIGTATIADKVFRVEQAAAPPCTYAINPSSIGVTSGAASGSVLVSTQTGCAWSAASSSPFLSIADGAGRSGSGSVTFNVAANANATERTGTAVIAGQTFTVTQAPLCTYSIDTAAITVGNAAADGTITVYTQSGCAWSASGGPRFITFTNGTGRSGPGTVSYSVSRNFANAPRNGAASIAGQAFLVDQAAAAADAAVRLRENARADFNADGRSDLLVQDTSGELAAWALNGLSVTSLPLSHRVGDSNWRISGTGDFNADGKPDIVWHHQSEGWVYLWYMDGVTRIGATYFSRDRVNPGWRMAGVGDFNADGASDLVWQNDAEGRIAVWLLTGVSLNSVVELPTRFLDTQWRVAGIGDFNGDRKSDLVLRHGGHGEIGVWLMDGLTRTSYLPFNPGAIADSAWRVAAVIDANGDDTPDIVWHHVTAGWVALWYMNGTIRMDNPSLPITTAPTLRIAGAK